MGALIGLLLRTFSLVSVGYIANDIVENRQSGGKEDKNFVDATTQKFQKTKLWLKIGIVSIIVGIVTFFLMKKRQRNQILKF